jgi:nitrogenase molybdenum-iron protein alpha chain
VRTIPGIITMRGCTYAGCKGVIMGPTRDIVNMVHGPIGCSFYAWLTRRNQTDAGPRATKLHDLLLLHRHAGPDIIFGGEKKLAQAIQEAYDLFHPKAIAIFATCPVGLIGDDIHAVARNHERKVGDCNVFAFSCEGYKGVSQSAGHHIANNRCSAHGRREQ